MSDTPQSDVTETDFNEVVEEVAINDSVPASETGEQVQAESKEQVDEVELAKQKANEAFNKQYGEKKQLERDLAAKAEELEKLQQAERERQAAQVGNIPPMPDQFDDDFEAKMKARDDAIAAQSAFNTQNQVYLQQQQAQQQEAAQAAQVQAIKLQNDFAANAKALGASDSEFSSIVTTLNGQGMTPDLANTLMSLGEDGYLISKHLAANLVEAHEVINMNPTMQGFKLAELKQKASALKPKTSSAPEPATNLTGNGVDKDLGQYKHVNSSAKFE